MSFWMICIAAIKVKVISWINLVTPLYIQTRIGVFAQGQILCISPNDLQASHCDAPPPPIWDDRKSLSIAFLDISDQCTIFFKCFHKMAAGGHIGWPKITFNRISRHFRSMRNFNFCFTKWLPAAILDDRKALSIAFLAISDQYANFYLFFHKMAACGHFGGPIITFDRISRHFRSIRNFFFTKWLPGAILDDRKSLSFTFLAISDQYATFF